jgi:hypothetical protein
MATRRKKKRSDMTVYFQDEAPRIGCGWRAVVIVKRGRKWTRVRDLLGTPAKLDNRTWAEIERGAR